MLIVSSFLFALLLAGGFFQALNALWDRRDKEALREKIVQLWIDTEELGSLNKLHVVLQRRYHRMKLLRRKFIKLFVILILCTAAWSAYTRSAKDTNIAGELGGYFHLDFDMRSLFYCGKEYRDSGIDSGAVTSICAATNSVDRERTGTYQRRRIEFEDFVVRLAADSPFLLSLSIICSDVMIVALIGIPILLALLISMNISLWLLSRVTRSRIQFVALVIIDLAIAILMPPFLAVLTQAMVIGGSIFALGQIPSFGLFESANWWTLTAGHALFSLTMQFLLPAFSFLAATLLTGVAAAVLIPMVFIIVLPNLVMLQISGALSVTVDFFRGDFLTAVPFVICLTMFVDLLFSAFYVVPSIAFVAVSRNATLRKMFLNLVMWVGDHSKGPLVAVSEIATALFTYVAKVWKGGA